MRKLLCIVALLALTPGAARAISVGAGAYGGWSIPVVQDDNGNGSLWGLRLPVNFTPMVSLEPYFGSTSGGSKTQDLGGGLSTTREGIDVTSYGVNALLSFGAGFKFMPFAGLGSNRMKRAGLDQSETGYDFGLGLGFSLPVAHLGVDLRGALNIVQDPATSQASRKWAEITAGVSYAFYHTPIIP
jgi:hypothetical protein